MCVVRDFYYLCATWDDNIVRWWYEMMMRKWTPLKPTKTTKQLLVAVAVKVLQALVHETLVPCHLVDWTTILVGSLLTGHILKYSPHLSLGILFKDSVGDSSLTSLITLALGESYAGSPFYAGSDHHSNTTPTTIYPNYIPDNPKSYQCKSILGSA